MRRIDLLEGHTVFVDTELSASRDCWLLRLGNSPTFSCYASPPPLFSFSHPRLNDCAALYLPLCVASLWPVIPYPAYYVR